MKVPNKGEFDYTNIDEFISISYEERKSIYIKGINDERRWKDIRNTKKDLFPSSWTEEMIAEAFKKVETRIKKVLLEDYGLPEYSPENASKYWKNIKGKEIKIRVSINGKEIELEIGGKYDENMIVNEI